MSLELLNLSVAKWKELWSNAKPFRYFIADNFLNADFAQDVYDHYPSVSPEWTKTTYAHQRRKYTLTENFPLAIEKVFAIYGKKEFCKMLTEVTGIQGLLYDPK